MSKYLVPTETLKFTEARPQLSELLNRVFRREARIVIQKGDIPVAALVSMNDLERIEAWAAEREKNFEILDEIGAVFAGIPPEEFEREVDRALIEVRARRRAKLATAANQ
jgi:prevent-host-death family protein